MAEVRRQDLAQASFWDPSQRVSAAVSVGGESCGRATVAFGITACSHQDRPDLCSGLPKYSKLLRRETDGKPFQKVKGVRGRADRSTQLIHGSSKLTIPTFPRGGAKQDPCVQVGLERVLMSRFSDPDPVGDKRLGLSARTARLTERCPYRTFLRFG